MRSLRTDTHMATIHSLPLKGRVRNLNANETHSRRASVARRRSKLSRAKPDPLQGTSFPKDRGQNRTCPSAFSHACSFTNQIPPDAPSLRPLKVPSLADRAPSRKGCTVSSVRAETRGASWLEIALLLNTASRESDPGQAPRVLIWCE